MTRHAQRGHLAPPRARAAAHRMLQHPRCCKHGALVVPHRRASANGCRQAKGHTSRVHSMLTVLLSNTCAMFQRETPPYSRRFACAGIRTTPAWPAAAACSKPSTHASSASAMLSTQLERRAFRLATATLFGGALVAERRRRVQAACCRSSGIEGVPLALRQQRRAPSRCGDLQGGVQAWRAAGTRPCTLCGDNGGNGPTRPRSEALPAVHKTATRLGTGCPHNAGNWYTGEWHVLACLYSAALRPGRRQARCTPLNAQRGQVVRVLPKRR